MSQDKKNTPNKNMLKTPKFNFYWIYGAIFILFIGYQFFNSGNLSSKNLSQNEFEDLQNNNRNLWKTYLNRKAFFKTTHNIFIAKKSKDE